MDAELIAYLDGRFRESAQQMQSFREEVLDRFEQVDARLEKAEARFGQIEARLEKIEARLDQVDARFEEVYARFEQIDARFEQIDARFKQIDDRLEKAAELARHTLVLMESLHHQLQLVAESVSGLITRVERLERKGTLSFDTFRTWMEPFFNGVEARGREVDARSIQLNVPVKDLDIRVGILEEWIARHGKEAWDALASLIAKSRPLPSE